jgi:nucleoside-diphosphate-sugar epimerase
MQRWTLVTGGAGYVGSVLVPLLLASGRRVRVLDSLLHGGVGSLLGTWSEDRFEFVRGDVRDGDAVRAAGSDVGEVVHLAAVVGDPACAREPEAAKAVNIEATARLLDLAEEHGAERFLFASTCSNYGKLARGDAYATEGWELSPVSLYSETKVAAELETLRRSRSGFSTTCLRLATVYGASPRMRFDLTVNEFTRDVFLTGEVVVYGEQFWRPYVHVRDAARAFVELLDAPTATVSGEVYNVGSTDENYRKLDLVELLRERVPTAEFEFVHKDEDPRDYRVSFDKVRQAIGFRTSRDVGQGIDEVARLLRSGLLEDPFAGIYRN